MSYDISIYFIKSIIDKDYTVIMAGKKIRGEYWIDNTGDIDFVDQSIGDDSHGSVVEKLILYRISDGFYGSGVDYDHMDSDKLFDDIAKRYWQEAYDDANDKKKKKLEKENPEYNTIGWNKWLDIGLDDQGVTDEEFAVIGGTEDARDYGMKKLGWKAVRGNDIDTWTFTNKDRRIIIEGLENILYEEGLSDEDEDEDQDGEEMEFHINVRANGKYLTMTLPELKGESKGQEASPEFGKNVAVNQVKNAELGKMHPYYQSKKFPFADWNNSLNQYFPFNS